MICFSFVLLHSDTSIECFYLGGVGVGSAYLFPFLDIL